MYYGFTGIRSRVGKQEEERSAPFLDCPKREKEEKEERKKGRQNKR